MKSTPKNIKHDVKIIENGGGSINVVQVYLEPKQLSA